MPKIFISYRRNDSASNAGRIYDRLEGHRSGDRGPGRRLPHPQHPRGAGHGHFVVVPSEEGVKELLIRAEAIGFRLKMFAEAAAKDKGVTVRFDPRRNYSR